MKKLLAFLVFGMYFSVAHAQIKDPVSWKYAAVKKSADTYEVVITASVEKPWHIYSQNTGAGGPVPTSFSFKKNPLVSVEGKTIELGKLQKVYDNNFKTEVLYYSGQVVFKQLVKVRGNVKTNISGTVEYMVCDDQQCLPPTKKSFDVKL
ncbi:protein-disulfide reductase DsbD domain-containing protein [Hydrotalea sp.]|uniref:protein-disulfide reductase DsbD domain-containing protein n=1 Tax=Hydrotalea sp. TaxID=2881279 RepID=UPI00260F7C8B|nr:protein-disulfide reductase DsbD domain-containing protein [Hydrotalea sp.]